MNLIKSEVGKMSLTVTSMANNYVNTYNFKNSETYKGNAVDETELSKSKYNISSVTNAVDTLSKINSVSLSSIGNITNYVNDAYKLSQSSCYNDLSNQSSSISDILSNNTDMSKLYGLSSTYSMSSSELNASLKLSALESSNSSSSYSGYLKESLTGSFLNAEV